MRSKKTKSGFALHVLNANQTITYVVSAHLWIEHLLVRSLFAVLPKPEAIFNKRQPSFSQLVDLAEAVDAIKSDFAAVLRCVNGLRNKYAHRLSFDPNSKEVSDLNHALQSMQTPFLIDTLPPTEERMTLALASICGWLQRRAKELGATGTD